MTASISETRKEILMVLKRKGRATVEELAEAMGVTGMAVRHHLAVLKAESYVQSEMQRHGVGRPHEVFSLTPEADEKLFPRAYDLVLTELIGEIEKAEGRRAVEALFARRKAHQKKLWAQRMEGKNFKERVAELAKILEEQGFMAELIETEDGFELVEHNCSVSKVAERFPQPCCCELELIQELLGAEVTRTQHRIAGDYRCSYIIKPRKKVGAKHS